MPTSDRPSQPDPPPSPAGACLVILVLGAVVLVACVLVYLARAG